MSNIAGKAYAMNIITPMRPWRTWIQRLIFMVSRCMPSTLSDLMGLKLIHFARWVIIRRDQWPDLGQGKQQLRNDYMLFCSNFNGTWDQYIDAFSDGHPRRPRHVLVRQHEIPAFDSDLRVQVLYRPQSDRHQLLLQCHAGLGAARHQARAAARRATPSAGAGACAPGMPPASPPPTGESLSAAKGKPGVQNCLGSPGVAPAASVATQRRGRQSPPLPGRARRRADQLSGDRACRTSMAGTIS